MIRHKISFVIALLCLAFLLSACGKAADPDNLFELTPEELAALTAPTGETTASTEEVTPTTPESGAQPTEIQEDGILPGYQYGNMQTRQNFMEYGDKIVFYYYDRLDQSSKNFTLCTYDKETGEVRRFCTDAACLHVGGSCAAGRVICNLEQYKGELYGMTDSSTIKQVKNGKFETITNGGWNFFHANNNLYVRTQDYSLVAFENGSKEPRMVLEECDMDGIVVFGHYLYASDFVRGISFRYDLWEENPEREVLLNFGALGDCIVDGYHMYYIEGAKTGFLYRCDMEGKNPEQLTEFPVRCINFDNDYLYFRTWEKFNPNATTTAELGLDGEDGCALYRMEKANPQNIVKLAELPDPIWFISVVPGYDKVFVENYSGYDLDNLNPSHYYAVDINTGEYELLERPE